MTDIEKAELIETLIAQRDMAASEADSSRAICDFLTSQVAAANADAAIGWKWARIGVDWARSDEPFPTQLVTLFEQVLDTHNARIDGAP